MLQRLRFVLHHDKLATWLLPAILLAALALRLYGINWDSNQLFHPDERAIIMKVWELSLPLPPDLGTLLDPAKSPINPRWFPYGSLPLYLLKLIAHLASYFRESLSGPELRLVGRAMSALLDVGTVSIIYLLGRRLYDRRIGLLAAGFVAFTVLNIQLSHFYAVDVLLAFLIVLTIFFAAGIMREGSLKYAISTGACLGLALATKVSVLPLLLAAIAAYALYCFSDERGKLSGTALSKGRLSRSFQGFLVVLTVMAAVFFISEPYALIDRQTFIDNTMEQSEMVRRIRDYPFTRQYIDTIPYLYQIEQLTVWGMGIPLGVVAWLGFLFAPIRIGVAALIRRHSDKIRADILLLSWIIPYFAIAGSFEVKFLRYLLPLSPFLCLLAARMLLGWWDRSHEGAGGGMLLQRWLCVAVIGIVLLFSIFYSLAYAYYSSGGFHIY